MIHYIRWNSPKVWDRRRLDDQKVAFGAFDAFWAAKNFQAERVQLFVVSKEHLAFQMGYGV